MPLNMSWPKLVSELLAKERKNRELALLNADPPIDDSRRLSSHKCRLVSNPSNACGPIVYIVQSFYLNFRPNQEQIATEMKRTKPNSEWSRE